jgi:multiple sugar transport system permease protein
MRKIMTYSLLIICSVLFLAPFYWMVVTAVKPPDEIYTFPPEWIPSRFVWQNFIESWMSQPFNTFLVNSVLVTVLTTVGQLISSSLVAYGFARFRFKSLGR